MNAESSLWPEIPLSALQHWRVCPRQCALIHIAGVWEENRLTAEGRLLHVRVHVEEDEVVNGVRITRGLQLVCRRLGLVGQADAVEFPKDSPPHPVEYKRGRPKADSSDFLQLCGQALCLEEMLGVHIPSGAVFYGATRRRADVMFTQALRAETEAAAEGVRGLLQRGEIPSPPHEPQPYCRGCSLKDYCKTSPHSVHAYLQEALTEC